MGKKACVAQGQTDEEGKKFAKYDDVVEKVKAAVATPDSQGGYADYLELLKEDVQKLFAELCDPEDEDGLFPYMSFLDRLTGKAYTSEHEPRSERKLSPSF